MKRFVTLFFAVVALSSQTALANSGKCLEQAGRYWESLHPQAQTSVYFRQEMLAGQTVQVYGEHITSGIDSDAELFIASALYQMPREVQINAIVVERENCKVDRTILVHYE